MEQWHIYLVRCRDGALYTGIATDVARRLREHQGKERRGAKYLRGRGPLEIAVQQSVGPRCAALRAEAKVKRFPKARKEEMIRTPEILDRVVRDALAGTPPLQAEEDAE